MSRWCLGQRSDWADQLETIEGKLGMGITQTPEFQSTGDIRRHSPPLQAPLKDETKAFLMTVGSIFGRRRLSAHTHTHTRAETAASEKEESQNKRGCRRGSWRTLAGVCLGGLTRLRSSCFHSAAISHRPGGPGGAAGT